MTKITSLSDLEIPQDNVCFSILGDDTLDFFTDCGVTGSFLSEFEKTFIPFKRELPQILGLNPKAYIIIRESKKDLPRNIAKKLLLVTQVMFHGYNVFNNEVKFFMWLHANNLSLENHEKPIDLLKTQEGITKVHSVLTRIEHGIPS